MRPPTIPPSVFHHPLELILGTPAAVRILRELSLHGGEIPTTALAERIRLSRQGTIGAIKRLLETGVIEQVGAGHAVSYRIDRRHPLSKPLTGLFKAEVARVDRIFHLIREFAADCEKGLVSIWLYGSVARHEDRSDSDLDLMVVMEEETGLTAASALREKLRQLRDRALNPSVTALTVNDIHRMAATRRSDWDEVAEDAVVLYGASPRELADG